MPAHGVGAGVGGAGVGGAGVGGAGVGGAGVGLTTGMGDGPPVTVKLKTPDLPKLARQNSWPSTSM